MAKPPPRLFVDAPLGSGTAVPLTQDHVHYLGKVLRLGEGDPIHVFNGVDGEWVVHLSEMGRRGGLATTAEMIHPQGTEPDVTLMFAPVKKGPTEYILQKATEMGVRALQPVQTARTVDTKIPDARWAVIVQEAAEQCERLTLPSIQPMVKLADAVGARPAHSVLFADESADDQRAPSWKTALSREPDGSPWAVLVGPAGGFTPDERSALRANPRCVPISLGPRILKAETAAVVALTLWQAVQGDLC